MTSRLDQGIGRFDLILAAVLWSLGSLYMRLLDDGSPWGLDSPKLSPLQIAFFRGLFAGAVLVPFVRPGAIRLRWMMVCMAACFGVMSGLYLSALGLGQAANAILLQNSAPLWVYLIGVYLLGEIPDQRSGPAIAIGLIGTAVIVAGNWSNPDGGGEVSSTLVLLMGLGSGFTYAAIVLFLRQLRQESGAWLMVLNLFGSVIVIGTFLLIKDGPSAALASLTAPTVPQLLFLAFFGATQMAAPYWLFTRGLRTVPPQEAAVITLLEPILNPIWAYLIAPEKEVPTVWTGIGGILLLGALVYRYWPWRARPSK